MKTDGKEWKIMENQGTSCRFGLPEAPASLLSHLGLGDAAM